MIATIATRIPYIGMQTARRLRALAIPTESCCTLRLALALMAVLNVLLLGRQGPGVAVKAAADSPDCTTISSRGEGGVNTTRKRRSNCGRQRRIDDKDQNVNSPPIRIRRAVMMALGCRHVPPGTKVLL